MDKLLDSYKERIADQDDLEVSNHTKGSKAIKDNDTDSDEYKDSDSEERLDRSTPDLDDINFIDFPNETDKYEYWQNQNKKYGKKIKKIWDEYPHRANQDYNQMIQSSNQQIRHFAKTIPDTLNTPDLFNTDNNQVPIQKWNNNIDQQIISIMINHNNLVVNNNINVTVETGTLCYNTNLIPKNVDIHAMIDKFGSRKYAAPQLTKSTNRVYLAIKRQIKNEQGKYEDKRYISFGQEQTKTVTGCIEQINACMNRLNEDEKDIYTLIQDIKTWIISTYLGEASSSNTTT